MNSSTIYLIGLALTVFVSLAVVFYLRKPLFKILIDLCETRERAEFWSTNTHILLVLVPLMFAMIMKPAPANSLSLVFAISTQLSWGLFGLIGTLLIQAVVISSYIPSRRRRQETQGS